MATVAVVALVLLAVFLTAGEPASTAQAAPQELVCTWQNIGRATKNIFHSASAMDTDNNIMYVYGGVDRQYAPSNDVMKVDLSGASLSASHGNVSASGAKAYVGAAGAYRAKGADSDDSAAYFFGGLSDPSRGNAANSVQYYMTKSGTWGTLADAGLQGRFFASAAYDPANDVIWIVGGISNCKLGDVFAGNQCRATSLPTQYMSWDAQGNPQMNTLSGGNQSLYAASMVYDAANTRMLIYGGTNNIQRGNSNLLALDLSSGDPATAQFATVSTQGSGPTAFFHGGALMSSQSWMVVYGGVNQDFLQQRESTLTDTWALDLSTTPNPTWVNLRPQGNPGDRVAGNMGYAGNHHAAVFVLGRDATQQDGEDPPEQEDVQLTTFALTCEDIQPTAVPPTSVPPTVDPNVTPLPNTPVPPTAAPLPAEVCDWVKTRVPNAVLSAASGTASSVKGYGLLCNPNAPVSPYNVERRFLSLENPNKPFHPLFNTVIWKCGCP